MKNITISSFEGVTAMSRQTSQNIARRYDLHLKRRPLATKMATNFAICCTGDLICQGIIL